MKKNSHINKALDQISEKDYNDKLKKLCKKKIDSSDGISPEFKQKISNLNFKLKTSESIDGAIYSNSKDINTITLVTGSLYLIGEVLNLN